MEFRPATGNAGTWTCQRGAYEHGCEFALVAGQNVLPAEIPSAPCRSYTASAPGGQCRYPVKASGKTVYHQGKHTPKNCWYFKENKTNALHTQKLFLLTLFPPITYDTLYFNCLIQPEGIKVLLLHRKREYPL